MNDEEFFKKCYGVKTRLTNLYGEYFQRKLTPGSHTSVSLELDQEKILPFTYYSAFSIITYIMATIGEPTHLMPTLLDDERLWVRLTARVLLEGKRAKLVEVLKINRQLQGHYTMQVEARQTKNSKDYEQLIDICSCAQVKKKLHEAWLEQVTTKYINKQLRVPPMWELEE